MGCEKCVEACEAGLMRMDDSHHVVIDSPYLCIVCFACVKVCNSDAVYVADAYQVRQNE